ncbi:choline dehydrogenase [Hyphomonas adhaerens]|uniref:Choline dehydrogenase n=1 Tax=Hyphomonas adhaerens TaxID=81029 RepID=A0A3B9GWM7_9PROT|nr:choline dehydrogenase [Hyphomonas adhaerens]HAE26798.1 choline dehydrogenase [Hyphomonas adhaerens]|tara:strand:+ start:655 stop:2349 length:1695 start_codon:yes stop_codon:yes gene_type:complete
MNKTFDYIIVGAGSAGCVLANRLSADAKNSVLLLEAGGSNRNLLIEMPTALSYPMASDTFNWGYYSQPEPGIDNRQISCPRGKGLGGTSSINGMVYVRGHSCDFQEWVEAGATGWGYTDCLPYFKRAETWQGGEDDYRGGAGPLGVSGGNNMKGNPLYQAFIDAGVEAGYPRTDDYNGYRQEGFGPMHMTVRGGVRESTSRAYLRPVLKRQNLTVLKHVLVDKVVFDGKRAVGVVAQHKGKDMILRANKEIILSAGAIASPMILQRSGIGPKAMLRDAGIQPVHTLPGVGQNLQDHLEVYFQFHCKQPVSLNTKLGLFSKFLIGARWLLFKTGLGATNHFESCAFIRSEAGRKSPDIQYHFLPAAMRYDGTASIKGHGFQVHVGPNKPKSRGSVTISSVDPTAAPQIVFNYLQHQDDVAAWRRCIRLTREIIAQPAMDMYRGEEIQPGKNIQSDEEIDRWVRENVESAYHPCGTCRMGSAEDEGAVVDTECRVNGLDGLRVVDASIFPTVPYGNINAPTIMVAEKASDIILGKMTLPPEKVESWLPESWETHQRDGTPKRVVSH